MKKLTLSIIALILFFGCKKDDTNTTSTGTIQGLTCNSAVFNSNFVKNIATSNSTLTIAYTGGNSGAYSASSINSTGVSGLTATIAAGNFTSSTGSLVYNITGTPTDSGTASFNISIGGKSCNITTKIANTAVVGTITSLNCVISTVTGTAKSGEVVAAGVKIDIPYTGGNGGTYSTSNISSTGVSGLTGTINAGLFTNGNGSLTMNISGTPTSSGTANFNISIAGKTCSVSLPVQATGTGTSAQISSLNCAGASLPTILSGFVPNGSIAIPYTAGNGGSYSTITVQSTGVTGITATLNAGSLINGDGMLNFILSGGTNATTGSANFTITFAGKTCNISIPIKYVVFKGKVDGVQYSGTPTLLNTFVDYFKFQANVAQLTYMSITFPKTTPNNTTLTVNKSTISSIAYQEGTTPWTTAFGGGTGSGTIFVEINDTVNRKVKGTFSGLMENGLSDRTMTNGIFDFTY